MKAYIDTVTTTAAGLKGRAKYTYNHAATAITEDSTPAMLHAFAALTDGAKEIVLQSGKFSNLYIRGERKGMAADEAATELEDAAAVLVSRKLRKIDHICAVAFLAEYISRQRKADEPTTEPTTPTTPNPTNTPSTMNANETTVTVSITDNGYKCEYTAAGKVIASITYRKEVDAYDVNTPSVGYITADVTEAHKACESGITWLLEQSGRKAAFDYTAVEEYNAAIA